MIGCVHQTRSRQGTRHVHTHLAITILAWCQAAWAPCQEWKFFFIRHAISGMHCMPMDSITEVFYHLNKMLIATKHIANNNFVFQ